MPISHTQEKETLLKISIKKNEIAPFYSSQYDILSPEVKNPYENMPSGGV